MGRRRDERIESAPIGQGSASLIPDPDRPSGWTLSIDGTPQSHVDLDDPSHLEFEYIRWLGHLADLMAPERPLGAVHLGGGAWTLARYIARRRPGSRQRVVEVDGPLASFVRERLPLRDTGIRIRIDDAREALESMADQSADLVVLDVFQGAQTPAHVTSTEFVAHVARVLRPGGIYAANIADGNRLEFARGQVATMQAVFATTGLISSPGVLRGRRFGNLLLLGSAGPLPLAGLSRATAGDPFGARVMDGDELTRFASGATPVDDAHAQESPHPPVNVLPLR